MRVRALIGFLSTKGKKLSELPIVAGKALIRFLVTAKEGGATQFFHFIPHTIAIVALLTAVEYFSGKPHLHVALHHNPQGFYLDTVQHFYRHNNLEIPRLVAKLFELFEKRSRQSARGYIPISSGTSDLDLVSAIKRGQDVGSYLKFRIEQLENQLDKHNYRKHIYFRQSERGFYRKEDFQVILDDLKSKLSNEDYFTFLTASIFSREVSNPIFVKNDGDLDLRVLQITFSPPLSKITETTKDNILDFDVETALPHDVKESPYGLTIIFPVLRKNSSFSLHIQTRENQIEENDIFYSYEADRTVDFKKAIFYSVVLFLVFTTLGLTWKRKAPDGKVASYL